MNIALISEYLETYSGRDKVLKILSYLSKLATITTSSKETEAKFNTFGSQLSQCRVILRLLDDIPILHHAINYKWNDKEPDWLIKWIELVQIVVDMICSPVEHIYWAGEHKLVQINIQAWDNATTWFWIVSLHLSLLKSVRKLREFEKYKVHLSKTKYNTRIPLKTVNKKWQNELLNCLRFLLDISYAVSYLPHGVLWGGRLQTWHVGALGTVSSFISLYQALDKLRQTKICS